MPDGAAAVPTKRELPHSGRTSSTAPEYCPVSMPVVDRRQEEDRKWPSISCSHETGVAHRAFALLTARRRQSRAPGSRPPP